MKKRILSVTAVLLMFFGPMVHDANAQIFLDEESMQRYSTEYGELPNVPTMNITIDQYDEIYAPLGGEVLVLGVLGGAYLMGKRRKCEQE